MALKLRRGLSANRTNIVPAEGELIYTTDTKLVYVGDGTTPGGNVVTGDGSGGGGGITELAEDTTPSLGGNLSITGYEINGDGDIDLIGDITVSGIGTGVITANDFIGDLTGNVIGDLTGNVLGDVTGNLTGDVAGDLTGDVYGPGIDLMLDATNRYIYTRGWQPFNNEAIVEGASDQQLTLVLQSNLTTISTNYPEADFIYSVPTQTITDGTQALGRITFRKEDSTGSKTRTLMTSYESGFAIAVQDPVSDLYTGRITWFDGATGGVIIGGSGTPAAKLDVRGDLKANAIKGTIVADDSTIIIDGLTGQVNISNSSIGAFNVSNPQTGQVLKWNGSEWANATDSGGSGGAGGVSSISIGADDSALRIVEGGEAFLILGGTGISTASDVEGNITITADFDGAFSSLTGTPTTLAGYGITDAATSAQGALADTALQPGDIFDVKGSVYADDSSALVDAVAGKIVGAIETTNAVISGTIDTADSSALTFIPAIVMNSDLSVENNLTVTNRIVADTIEVTNLITAGAGTPELESETELLLTAGTRVSVNSSPFKLCSYTTAERDAVIAENGDMIYNTTTNKLQGYQNGSWINLDGTV